MTELALDERYAKAALEKISFDINEYPTLKAASLSPAIVRTIRGPAGSAKTSWVFMELLRRSIEQAPGADGVRRSKWLVGRLTYQVLVSATLESAARMLGSTFKARESIPPTVKGKFDLEDGTKVDVEFEFLSLEGEDAMAKLLGGEWTGAFLDEVSEVPEKVVHAVLRRLGRYPSASHGTPTWVGLICVTNGPIEGHWLQKWELGENRELLEQLSREISKNTGEDRPFFHAFAQPPALLRPHEPDGEWTPNPRAENVKNLHGGYGYYYIMLADDDDAKIRAFVEGEFAPLKKGKLVFPSFRKALHVVPYEEFQVPDGVPIGLSFDFGRTPVCGVYVTTGSGRLVKVEEITGEDISIEGLFVEKVQPLLRRNYRGSVIEWATGDPTGADKRDNVDLSPFQVLWNLGVPIEVAGSNRIEARLEAVKQRLSRIDSAGQAMLSIRSNCTFTIEALSRNYIYEQVKTRYDTVRDTPTKSHVNWVSDLADETQYACQYNALEIVQKNVRDLPPLARRWA